MSIAWYLKIKIKYHVTKCINQYWLGVLNPLHVGYIIFFPDPQTGLFSVKIQKKFLAIKNFSVNDTMSGQPNKHLIHWHFEN